MARVGKGGVWKDFFNAFFRMRKKGPYPFQLLVTDFREGENGLRASGVSDMERSKNLGNGRFIYPSDHLKEARIIGT